MQCGRGFIRLSRPTCYKGPTSDACLPLPDPDRLSCRGLSYSPRHAALSRAQRPLAFLA
jgi:hypothetical protein